MHRGRYDEQRLAAGCSPSGREPGWWDYGTRTGIRRPAERPRWERCIEHRDLEVEHFIRTHFGNPHCRVLLVGGAGFDPRAHVVPDLVVAAAADRVDGIFLRERRVLPSLELRAVAERRIEQLQRSIPGATVLDVQAIDADDAVVLGRNVVTALHSTTLDDYTDVIIDFSALSIGSCFPAARLLLERVEHEGMRAGGRRINLHAMVCENADLDQRIVPIPSPQVDSVHTFKGGLELDVAQSASRLWMPQLRMTHKGILNQVFLDVNPDEVVPVIPFPAHDPRLGDRLIAAFSRELTAAWRVDGRGIVYASESHPLDFYRTVLRIHDGRDPVYREAGGSAVILTPVGSKTLAIGAMMAALERDLPVRYVEARGYEHRPFDGCNVNRLVHIWLAGAAYPPYVS